MGSGVGCQAVGWRPDPPPCASNLGIVAGHGFYQQAGPLMHGLKVQRIRPCPAVVGTGLCGEIYLEKSGISAIHLWRIHPSFFHGSRSGPAWLPGHPPPWQYCAVTVCQLGVGGGDRGAGWQPLGRGSSGPAQPAQERFWRRVAGLDHSCLSIHTWVRAKEEYQK